MHKLTALWTLSLLCIFTSGLSAQDFDDTYKEVKIPTSNNSYYVVSLENDGVIMFYESESEKSKNQQLWEIVKLNTDFEEEYTGEFEVDNKLNYTNYQLNEGKLHLIFTKPYVKGPFSVVNIDLQTGSTELAKGILPSMAITDFTVTKNDMIYVSGYTTPTIAEIYLTSCLCYVPIPLIPYLLVAPRVYRAENLIVSLDMTNDRIREVQEKLPKQSFVISTKENKNGNLDALIRNDQKKKTDTYLYTFDVSGDINEKVKIKGKSSALISQGYISEDVAGEKVLLGTYIKKRQVKGIAKLFGFQSAAAETFAAAASGMYIGLIVDGKQEFINYYTFNEIKSFKKYSELRKRKKKKKKKKDDKPTSQRVLLHDITKVGENYLTMGELYYATYRTETYYNASTKSFETRQVFDGWQYYSAFAVCFSKDGELLWDVRIDLDETPKTFVLREMVKVRYSAEKESIDFMYSKGRYAVVKTANYDGEFEDEGRKVEIMPEISEEAKRTTSYTNVSYWYGDYFLAYGYKIETVKKKNRKRGQKRNTTKFYFKKVDIEDAEYIEDED